MSEENRRKVSGIVVDSQALLRFAVPFLILVVGSVLSILLMHWQILAALVKIETISNYDPATAVAVTTAVSQITNTGMICMFALGCICLAFWIIYSHRIFGPVVPFRRHIASLLSGDFSSRIKLRKRDEFKAVAEDLNKLAEMLESKKI